MKKTVLLIALSLIAPITVIGQTFHSIIFANTENRGIGASVSVDLKRMGLEMTTIAKSIGYTLKKYYYYGGPENFNYSNLDKVLQGLSCSSDDIVFFYYSGHGGRFIDEKTRFPEMCLFPNDEDPASFYPLHDVYSRILKKKPRLTIVMGDLCNSLMKGSANNDNTASKGATILSKGTCDVYRNLFLNAKGGLIAASSEPKYSSSCYIFEENGNWYHAGGYFTHSFLCVLQYFVTQNEDVSWEALMENTIDVTRELSKTDANGNSRRPQTPIFIPDIASFQSNSDNSNIIAPPQPPQPSNDNEINQLDNLSYSLSMVCNKSIPKLDRIRNIPKTKNYFKNMQTKVQVIGFDNKTIVNTCSIESYLNYLSIAANMDQVVVLETEKDASGKVTYIKVHEIHYQ